MGNWLKQRLMPHHRSAGKMRRPVIDALQPQQRAASGAWPPNRPQAAWAVSAQESKPEAFGQERTETVVVSVRSMPATKTILPSPCELAEGRALVIAPALWPVLEIPRPGMKEQNPPAGASHAQVIPSQQFVCCLVQIALEQARSCLRWKPSRGSPSATPSDDEH
jgi:hypothetical protein